MDFNDTLKKRRRKFVIVYCITILFTIAASALTIIFNKEIRGIFPSWSKECTNKNSCKNASPISESQVQRCPEICTSPECLVAASTVLSMMDPDSDPCRDFVAFSCGKIGEDTYIPNDAKNVQTIHRLNELLKLKVTSLFDDVSSGEDIQIKRKQLMDSCLKFETSEDTGFGKIRDWLSSAGIPDWPTLDEGFSLSEDELYDVLVSFTSIGDNPLYELRFETKRLPDFVLPFKEKTGLTLDPIYETGTGAGTVYVTFSKDCYSSYSDGDQNATLRLLNFMGVAPHDADVIARDVKNVSDLFLDIGTSSEDEKRLLNCTQSGQESRWCKLIVQQLEITGYNLNFSDAVFAMEQPEWFDFLEGFLNGYNHRMIINYLVVSLLERIANYLRYVKHFRVDLKKTCSYYRDFEAVEVGRKSCMEWIMTFSHNILTPEYVKKYEVMNYVQQVQELLQRNIEAVEPVMQNVPYISEETVAQFTKSTIDLWTYIYVYYYETHYDVETRMQKLILSEDDFVGNVFALEKYYVDDTILHTDEGLFSRLKERSHFDTDASSGELVDVKFGLLEQSILDFGTPRYLDFGTLGMILGHEITHNFHMTYYELNTTETKSFMDCLIQMYDKDDIPELKFKVNGTRTFGENFADVVGIQIAYKAYLKYLQENGEDPALPGLNFTNQQMFFIAFSQMFCEFGDKEGFEKYREQSHSPGSVRVDGSIRNFEAFAEAFHCPVGTPMNPTEKCLL